jgi:flagellar biosynthetic protein FlhB
MNEEHGQSKTEAATPRRREEARKKGRVAYSSDLAAGLLLLSVLLALWWIGPQTVARLEQLLRGSLGQPADTEWSFASVHSLASSWTGQFVLLAAPFVVISMLIAAAAGLLQAGFRVSFEPLKVDWERLSPARGWSRLCSGPSVMRGVMALLKAAIVGVVAWWCFTHRAGEVATAGALSLRQAMGTGWAVTMHIALAIVGTWIGLALVDYLFQRFRHEQELRMSRRELVEEQKQDQGDPHVRARIKKLQREAATRRSLLEVPRATVVVSNPTHFAVALRYERATMRAPRVVAKGADLMARTIIDMAKKHNVPVLERKPLARALYASVRLGEEIPFELYQAVAEILALLSPPLIRQAA